MSTIREKRDQARAEMRESAYLTILVRLITEHGHARIGEFIAEATGILQHHGVPTDLPTEELKAVCKRAKQLSEHFKCNTGVRGKIIKQYNYVGRPKVDYTNALIGGLHVIEATGYVNATSAMNSALWLCQCEGCDIDMIKTAHALSHELLYCGRGKDICPEGYIKAKDWRKNKIKLRDTITQERATEAAEFITHNVSKGVH